MTADCGEEMTPVNYNHIKQALSSLFQLTG